MKVSSFRNSLLYQLSSIYRLTKSYSRKPDQHSILVANVTISPSARFDSAAQAFQIRPLKSFHKLTQTVRTTKHAYWVLETILLPHLSYRFCFEGLFRSEDENFRRKSYAGCDYDEHWLSGLLGLKSKKDNVKLLNTCKCPAVSCLIFRTQTQSSLIIKVLTSFLRRLHNSHCAFVFIETIFHDFQGRS